jgi:putative endonuclease
MKTKTEKQRIGQIGEDLACKYLQQKSYKILERNHRQVWGELDIICKKENLMVFVEVKTTTTYSNNNEFEIKPEDQMSSSKIKILEKTILSYLNFNKINLDWQLDLIAIELNQKGELLELRHLEQIS